MPNFFSSPAQPGFAYLGYLGYLQGIESGKLCIAMRPGQRRALDKTDEPML